jgi:activator of 2-hydroxyglutaryl-CoA dehydratase
MPFYSKSELRDIAERALSTAIQSFLAVFAVSDMSTLQTAGVAAFAAAVSVIQRAVAARLARKPVSDIEDPHL